MAAAERGRRWPAVRPGGQGAGQPGAAGAAGPARPGRAQRRGPGRDRADEGIQTYSATQLRMLAGAGLVASRRDGVRVIPARGPRRHRVFTGQVQDFAASRLAEAEHAARSYIGDGAALEPVAQGRAGPAAERRAGSRPGRPARGRSTPPGTHPRRGQRAPRPARRPAQLSYLPGPTSWPTAGAASLRVCPPMRYGSCGRAPVFRSAAGGRLPGWRLAGLPVTAAASACRCPGGRPAPPGRDPAPGWGSPRS